MKLYTKCKNCNQEIFVKYSVNDRAELARENGELLSLKCEGCSKEYDYHVNDIKAKEDKMISLIAFIIFFLGTGIIGYLIHHYIFRLQNASAVLTVGSLILIPSIIFNILNKQESDNVNRFNQFWT